LEKSRISAILTLEFLTLMACPQVSKTPLMLEPNYFESNPRPLQKRFNPLHQLISHDNRQENALSLWGLGFVLLRLISSCQWRDRGLFTRYDNKIGFFCRNP
jgi:hypothetical protein